MTRRGPLCALLLALLLLALSLPPRAAADYDPFVVVTPVSEEDQKKTDVQIGTLQDRLTELGYYKGNKTFLYDVATQYAVSGFCETNGVPFDEKGIRQSLWDLMMGPDAVPAKGSAAYEDLRPGASGEAVLAMQTRLKALNYYDGGLVLTPEVFDEDTQTAVRRFCESNNVAYDGSGASAAIQQLIFSDGAVEYVLPEVEETTPEKVSGYMMQDVDILVATVPMFAVWLAAALLLALIAAVVVHFFVHDAKPPEGPSVPAARPVRAEPAAVEPISQDKLHGERHPIEFQIEYQGRTRSEQLVCTDALVIGRGEGGLQLDKQDHMVSRVHCELRYEGAVLMLSDRSTNGTLVNGSPIHNCRCRVNSGDKLTIGAHNITIRF